MAKIQAEKIDAPENDFLVAVDDGHSEIKVAYFENGTDGQIHNISFPSRTVRGWEEMDAAGGVPKGAYLAFDSEIGNPAGLKGEQMLVVERGRDHENRTQDYPKSDRNRVLVHHALQLATRGRPARVTLATTLPYSDFYLPETARLNVDLIEAKKQNLRKTVCAVDGATLAAKANNYRIGSQSVYAEGVATFFDLMLDIDSDGNPIPNEKFASRFEHSPGYAVIDIGGKTTDVVYGTWSGNPGEAPLITKNGSTSLKEGTLQAADNLAEALKHKFNLRRIADPERALFNGQVAIFGEVHDVSDEVEKVTEQLFNKIREPILRHLEDASDLSYVVFVGGGTRLLEKKLRSLLNPAVVLVPDRPQFSNANGLLKVLKLAHLTEQSDPN